MSERVGFIGLGDQGGPIAMRIIQGRHPMTVWARRPEATGDYVRAGAAAARSVAQLGSTCDLVALCVLADDDVLQVALGEDGLIGSMPPGSSLAIHSTVHPDTVRAVHAAGAERGIAVVDAPVSGGSAGARAGTMAVLLGGDEGAIDRWRPVLATFATTVEVMGAVGAGQTAKLVNNAVSAANLGNALHALGSAAGLGLDRSALFRIMSGGSAGSFMLGPAFGLAPAGAGHAASRLRKDLVLFQRVLGPDDTEARALADAAELAVTYLESLAV